MILANGLPILGEYDFELDENAKDGDRENIAVRDITFQLFGTTYDGMYLREYVLFEIIYSATDKAWIVEAINGMSI